MLDLVIGCSPIGSFVVHLLGEVELLIDGSMDEDGVLFSLALLPQYLKHLKLIVAGVAMKQGGSRVDHEAIEGNEASLALVPGEIDEVVVFGVSGNDIELLFYVFDRASIGFFRQIELIIDAE